jgi:hypothetical protein
MDDLGTGYRPYWVGYFDLLGFENRVKTMRWVWPILEEYDKALGQIRRNQRVIGAKWFSDTFLFYVSDDSDTAFCAIEDACESFFYRMVMSRIPVRGCLTVGDFYVDEQDGVLAGPALIDAYHLGECQDWIGFVLSRDAVTRCDQYKIRRDSYKEYDVPISDKRSGELRTERLEAFNMSHDSPPSPAEWWKSLDDMEHDAVNFTGPEERERILQKYRNSKKYLLSLYPRLAEVVQGEYGSIASNKPEIRKKIRELFGG